MLVGFFFSSLKYVDHNAIFEYGTNRLDFKMHFEWRRKKRNFKYKNIFSFFTSEKNFKILKNHFRAAFNSNFSVIFNEIQLLAAMTFHDEKKYEARFNLRFVKKNWVRNEIKAK